MSILEVRAQHCVLVSLLYYIGTVKYKYSILLLFEEILLFYTILLEIAPSRKNGPFTISYTKALLRFALLPKITWRIEQAVQSFSVE